MTKVRLAHNLIYGKGERLEAGTVAEIDAETLAQFPSIGEVVEDKAEQTVDATEQKPPTPKATKKKAAKKKTTSKPQENTEPTGDAGK